MNVPAISLNDGNSIPQLGYGLWQVSDEDAESSVLEALKTGYRSIDSAQVYQNEEGLGRAIKASGLPRNELFITTKIWNSEQGRDNTLRSFDVSMEKLGLEKLDLLLIHWPMPRKNLYVDTWKALVELKQSGRVASIGVSNFYPEHLEKIIQETGNVPVLNQIELHPRFQQKTLREFHEQHGIKTECWSPLGQGTILHDGKLKQLAEKHGKSVAQVILRWHMEMGFIAIPKSVTPSRIHENFHVFDFQLDEEDLAAIEEMDSDKGRVGPDPMTANF